MSKSPHPSAGIPSACLFAVLGTALWLAPGCAAEAPHDDHVAVVGLALTVEDCERGADEAGKVMICHGTGSETNPFRAIEVDREGCEGHVIHESDFVAEKDEGCGGDPRCPLGCVGSSERCQLDGACPAHCCAGGGGGGNGGGGSCTDTGRMCEAIVMPLCSGAFSCNESLGLMQCCPTSEAEQCLIFLSQPCPGWGLCSSYSDLQCNPSTGNYECCRNGGGGGNGGGGNDNGHGGCRSECDREHPCKKGKECHLVEDLLCGVIGECR